MLCVEMFKFTTLKRLRQLAGDLVDDIILRNFGKIYVSRSIIKQKTYRYLIVNVKMMLRMVTGG